MRRADRVLFVIDAAADPTARAYTEARAALPEGVPVTLVLNKCDLVTGVPLADTVTLAGPQWLAVSAKTGEGLPLLREHLKRVMGYSVVGTGTVTARARHLEALALARRHVEAAVRLLNERRAGELMAEELRAAQRALEEITGAFTSEDLLGRIFSSFCIGK
jgi:tRNA modification GTPase